MLDRPSIAVKKSVVMRVGALLAMMAILVLSNPAPNGIFAHPHDSGQTHLGVAADADHIHYAENGTGMRCGTSIRQTPRGPRSSGT